MNFWYVRNEESDEWELVFGAGYGWSDFPCYGGYEYKVPTIHVFDLLLPENAKRLWKDDFIYWAQQPIAKDFAHALPITHGCCPTWAYHSYKLLSLIQSNGDYEGYIKSTMIV